MSQDLTIDGTTEQAKQFTRLLYIAHMACFFFSFGLFSIIPLIINYSKRPDTQGTFLYSHHSWMIRSFWTYVILIMVGFALFITFIGIPLAWLIWVCAWLWKAYRLIRGFVDLNNNRTMPD